MNTKTVKKLGYIISKFCVENNVSSSQLLDFMCSSVVMTLAKNDADETLSNELFENMSKDLKKYRIIKK